MATERAKLVLHANRYRAAATLRAYDRVDHREGSISLGAAYNDATSTVWAVVTAVPDHEDVAEKGLRWGCCSLGADVAVVHP
ncbi:hypothetical protein G3M48_001522 [Beauveria asiatica]|uniref:Uncharacterized protein n=1 Tax=Beauveria asiatica TaxID=1069075 RepID=A0AAW0RFW9_9HYPO